MEVKSDTDPGNTEAGGGIAFDRTIDWVLGGMLGIIGVVTALGGGALYSMVSRADVATVVQSGEFQSDTLTEAEAIDVLTALSNWTGIGLLVAGGLFVLLGIAVVLVHRRVRRAEERTPAWILGVLGASIASLLSFVPFSPLLGGLSAAYLDPDPDASGAGVGAIAGLIGVVPLLVILGFMSVGLLTTIPGQAAGVFAVVLVIVTIASLAYYVGLSTLGGFVGRWVRDR